MKWVSLSRTESSCTTLVPHSSLLTHFFLRLQWSLVLLYESSTSILIPCPYLIILLLQWFLVPIWWFFYFFNFSNISARILNLIFICLMHCIRHTNTLCYPVNSSSLIQNANLNPSPFTTSMSMYNAFLIFRKKN